MKNLREEAEKICDIAYGTNLRTEMDMKAQHAIESVLKEVVEEAEKSAYEKFRKDYRWACQCDDVDCGLTRDMLSRGAHILEEKGRKEGKAKGLEQAAQIADQHAMQFSKPINEVQEACDGMARRIASKIRALMGGG